VRLGKQWPGEHRDCIHINIGSLNFLLNFQSSAVPTFLFAWHPAGIDVASQVSYYGGFDYQYEVCFPGGLSSM
jgi:hypothetical protein